MVEKIL